MASAIRLPSSPTRGVNIECNAPLSTFNARVEKGFAEYGLDGDDSPHRAYVPRAHESAVEQSEKAFRRKQEQADKLNMFLVQTRARIISGTKEGQEADAVLDDKTRRRLDQSWTLIPRPSTAPKTNRNRTYGGARPTSAVGAPVGEGQVQHLLPASAIAIQMGSAVHSDLADSVRARESLLAHRRTPQQEDDTPPSPEMMAEHRTHPSPSAVLSAAQDVSKINSSICSQGKATEGFFEGERNKKLREESKRVLVYKEIRSAMMQGERARVREYRQQQEEHLVRLRQAEEEGRKREAEALERALEAQRAERHRLQGIQAAMAANLEAEKELEDRVREPKRQQLQKGRFREALRCRLLDTSTTAKAKAIPLCPCNPPRTVADGRVWLCANNCSLNGNLKQYHRLVRDLHPNL